MNIALITIEYPPEKDYGGIAIYMKQIAEILLNRDHYVEVFTVSELVEGVFNEGGLIVNKIKILPDEGLDKVDIVNEDAKLEDIFLQLTKAA